MDLTIMVGQPTYRLSEFSEIVGDLSPTRAAFWCRRGQVLAHKGGDGRGSHRQFTQDEVRVAQLAVALDAAGVSRQPLISIAASFRTLYLPAASPRSVEDMDPVHQRCRRRVLDALAGAPTYLLVVGHPTAARAAEDPKDAQDAQDAQDAHQLDLCRPNEIPGKLSGHLSKAHALFLVNLTEIWSGSR